MKSSTIRRSNLSKEKMAVLEALSKYNNFETADVADSGVNNEPVSDDSPEVYVRQNKDKELDMLWKDFKLPRGERSPIIYLGIGFITGVLVTLIVSAFIGMSSGNFHIKSANTEATAVETPVAEAVQQESAVQETVNETETEAPAKKFGLFGAKSNNNESTQAAAVQTNKEYEVQSGDTMEKIVRQFYGSYSGEKVEAIMNLNNMKDANKLSIGQKLLIPVDGTVGSNSAE
ncbi:MAG: LysM peptidoglycan-binding domain-containing protein [Candidatus Gastranaerophilaceae bacterium]|nr:LysM peptidoglycan-binding domain-containing protein [Candidatus Gastranaerophilaceae bacterium]